MKKILFILFFIPCFVQAQMPIVNGWRHASSCDADAQAFIDSTGITGTEATAICQLVKDLKDSSLWSSMLAIYPFVGGTSTSCKWNLKDPRDLDAAYRLTFTGSWSFSSTGGQPDGSTAYANTHLTPNSVFTYDNVNMSYYSRTSAASGVNQFYEMGSGNNIVGGFSVFAYRSGGASAGDFGEGVNNRATFTDSDGLGYYIASSTSSTGYLFKNGVQVASKSSMSGAGVIGVYTMYVGGFNEGNVANVYYSIRECAMATIGTGLSTAQMATLNTIVESFQDALGRGVQ